MFHGPTGYVDYGFGQRRFLQSGTSKNTGIAASTRPSAMQNASNYKNIRIKVLATLCPAEIQFAMP